MIRVNLYATFRPIVGSKSCEFDMSGNANVGEVLAQLFEQYPALRPEILDEEGRVQKYVSIFVAGRDVRHLEGLETPLTDGQTLDLFPPVAGGAEATSEGTTMLFGGVSLWLLREYLARLGASLVEEDVYNLKGARVCLGPGEPVKVGRMELPRVQVTVEADDALQTEIADTIRMLAMRGGG